MCIVVLFVAVCMLCCQAIIEPYPPLHGGSWKNNSYLSQFSFDPIINYIWRLNDSSLNTSALQIYNVTPKYATTDHEGSFDNLYSMYLTPNDINVIVYGPGNITIDFGFENAGWFEIDSNDCDDNGLTMSISEYNEPGKTLDPSFPKTLKPVKYTNNGITTYRLETNKQLYDGVRFGFIHVSKQTNKPWHIIGVRVVAQIKPDNYIGSFQSNQYPMLNYIWYTAAYCVKMNMLPWGMGSILLDRGDRIAFMGDDHISIKVAMYAFGAYDFVKQSIIDTKDNTDNILSYPLYWITSIYDYYLLTNDTTLLTTLEGMIQHYLNQSISVFGTNPAISLYGWDERIGAGFENANHCPEAQYAYQMLTIETIGKSLIFFEKNALNNIDLYNYYSSKRTEFINIIRKDSNYLNKYGLHSSADAINGLWMTQNETNYLFSQWFNDSVNICSYSPFNSFYISNAIGVLKRSDYLLSTLDLCWGNQIRLGATTFWEMFDPKTIDFLEPNDAIENAFGMTSLCHPWSSGALSIINDHVVGFQILKPGFQHIKIEPILLQIRATIPMYNNKMIMIDFDGLNGKYIINIPMEIEMDIYFPTISLVTDPIIYMNDNVYDIGKIKIIKTKHQRYWMIHFNKNDLIFNKDNYFQILSVTNIANTSISQEIPNVFPPPYYPCSVVSKDFETKGNWINKYGKEGYILFAYQSSTNNLSNLPKWVKSVKGIFGTKLMNFVETTSDERALQNPTNPNKRALGAIYYTSHGGGPESFAMNITIDKSMVSSYYMSIYLCDWDNSNRRQSIHIFDAMNLNVIAPIVYDEDYVNGVWTTFKLDRSIRTRIYEIRGPTNVLSGIFFDTNSPY
eukprot:120033_1